ncbi:dihydrofolate reductase [Lysinibacillus capsici]
MGGSEIYIKLMPYVDKNYLTIILKEASNNADTYFPTIYLTISE